MEFRAKGSGASGRIVLGLATILTLLLLGSPAADIFRLHAHRDPLLTREGWKVKSVDNLFASIKTRRTPDPARFLFGLGIRHVGIVTARDLVKAFGTVERVAEVAMHQEAVLELSGVEECLPLLGMQRTLSEERDRQ